MRYILIVLITIFCFDAHGQTIDTTSPLRNDSATKAVLTKSSTGHIMWHDIKDGWYDLGQYVQRPFHFSASQWGLFGAGVAVTAGFEVFADVPIRTVFQKNQSKFGDAFSQFGDNFYGDGYATALTFVSLYTTGLASDNNKIRVMGLHVIESFAFAGLTTTGMKILIGRDRPILYNGKFIYNGPSLANVSNSMPSGHVTGAAALSESLAEDIHNTWVSVGLYSFVSATAIARMYTDQHWFSDTFMAGIVGLFTGFWVDHQADHYDMKTNDPKPSSFDIEPTADGVGIAYHF